VEAVRVPHAEAFFMLAEERMSRPDRPVEWYAFGAGGFGVGREYLLVRHYVMDYRPDIVVLLFVANDPIDCSPYLAKQASYGPRFHLDDRGGLVLSPPDRWVPSTFKRMVIKSSLVRYLYFEHRLFAPSRPPPSERVQAFLREDTVLLDEDGSDTGVAGNMTAEDRQRKTWELVELLLAQTRDECHRRGAIFALAWYGTSPEVEAAAQGTSYVPPHKDVDPYCVGPRLDHMGKEHVEPIARRLAIPYLDLTPAMVAAAKETGTSPYFPNDCHYNAVGNAVVAVALSDWVETLFATADPSSHAASGVVLP
jgi:hypothetical protein